MNTCLHRHVGLVIETNYIIQYDLASQACDSNRFYFIIYSIILDLSGTVDDMANFLKQQQQQQKSLN